MGQTGSVEQKNAIRNVITIKAGQSQQKEEKDVILKALQTFTKMFPIEEANVGTDDGGALDVKERKLFDTVYLLLQEQTERTERKANEELIELILASFKRIIMWRELYRLCAKCSMKPLLNCLILSPRLSLVVLDTISAMITPCPGVEINEKTEKWETSNRRNFGDGGGYEVLRSLMVQYSVDEDQIVEKEAIIVAVLEIFHLTLVTRRNTSDLLTCSQAVAALMNARISLLDLCHHQNSSIQDYAIDLVKELFSLIDLEQVHELQESAREYGALLYALFTAVAESRVGDKQKNDGELTPTNSSNALKEKCIDLVEMFCAGNTRSKKAMYRIFPVELFIPAENRSDLISRHTASSLLKRSRATNRSLPHFSFDLISSAEGKRSRVTSLATTVTRIIGAGAFEKWLHDARSQGEHWRNIIESVLVNHERPELVWRDSMREELRQALRMEIEFLEKAKRTPESSPGSIARWEHEMFYVNYNSIQKELVVNGYFIQYLIPKVADLANSHEIVDPVVLAWHLSDQLAVEENQEWRVLCVRCLRLIIRRYAMIFHGQLPTRHVLSMLKNHNNYPPAFIRECFLLLNTAIATTRNTPSESLNRLSVSVTLSVIDILCDPELISNLSSYQNGDIDTENEDSDDDELIDADEEQVYVNNESDGLIRAGINVLLAIIRRSKYTLLLIRPKRVFICRLLAVETLDHITIERILVILRQLAMLDINGSLHVMSVPLSSGKSAMDANWKSLALVYILFASCDPKGMGMCLAAAEFLKENFALTPRMLRPIANENQNDKTSKSEFKDLLNDALGYGGCGMGPLLDSSTAETFAEVFNAHEKRAADVNWGRRQRIRLFRYLKRKYVASSDHTENQQEDRERLLSIADEDDDDDIFVGNIFLRSYIEGDGQFLNEWSVAMYRELISALFIRLIDLGRTKSVFGAKSHSLSVARTQAEPWEIQVLILKALVRLVPSHCSDVEVKKEHYESLLTPMRRTLLGESDQIRGILALELFIAILAVSQEHNVNTEACRAFLEEQGLAVLGDALERMQNPTFQQLLKVDSAEGVTNTARVLLYRITDLLVVLSSQPAGIQAIVKNPLLITSLLDLSSKQTIMTYSEDAATVCLRCLASLCNHEELRTIVVESGGLLSLLETSAFCPAEDIVESSNSGGEENESSDGAVVLQRKPSRFFHAVQGAALTLRVCLDSFSETSPTYQVLKQLVTPSFLRILRSSVDKFILQLQSSEDINSATLIWTGSMRKRLQDCLAVEQTKVKTAAKSNIWPRWNPDHFVAADSFRYQYPELADELILHDVYLNNFVVANDVDLDDIDMSAFSEALLISIQSNENVMRILQQRGASDHGKEIAVGVMRQAMNKLVSAHPQHNLEVDQEASLSSPTGVGSPAVIDSNSNSSVASPPASSLLPLVSREPITDRRSSIEIEDLTV